MHRLKKTVLIFTGIVILTVSVIILCISPIAKYLIEKYDEKYTGRQITLDRSYVNPFTGFVYLKNLKVHEFKSDTVFFSANGVSVNFALMKMLSKTYEITELTLDDPWGKVIQNKTVFNFNDIIEKFTPDKNADTTKAPLHFNILKIKINNGEFHYCETVTPINYFIKHFDLESEGKNWDVDTMAVKFSFLAGIGKGNMNGNLMVNLKDLNYRLAVKVKKFDMNIIEQYMKDLTNYGSFSAYIDANIRAKGNFKDKEAVTMSGGLSINDFHFGRNQKDDYVSFDELTVAIKEVSPKDHRYLYDSISLNKPYFKYEKYDYLDNVGTMFGKEGSKVTAVTSDPSKFNLVVEIARYIKVLAKNFFKSPYQVGRLAIYNADLKFNDFSTSEKFSAELDPLYITADSINKNQKRVSVYLTSGIKPYGNLAVTLHINPKDSSDFEIVYGLKKLPASLFNPYTITYTSFPLERGTIELNGNWQVRNGNIQSANHFVMIDPLVSKRIRKKDTRWIPMPLIMAFVRERGNVIDYEIPINGNLRDPKFHVRDVVFDILKNMFIKPVTTPYRIRVKNTETEIERSLVVKWQTRNAEFLPVQEKFVEKMARFLKKNPDAIIDVYPQQYALKEKEYILFFQAKKKYYLLDHNIKASSFSEGDSLFVERMSVKDSSFVHYLNEHVKNQAVFTIQEKCEATVDPAAVNRKYEVLNKERIRVFRSYFKKEEVEKQVRIHKGKNTIPYNGFSFYKMHYEKEFPESLLKAYRKMLELNDKEPRKKFKKYRKGSETLVSSGFESK